MRETEPRESPPFLCIREVWILLILLGLAFAVRLYMVFHIYLITNDGVLYVKMAELISQGQAGAAFRLLFFSLYPVLIAVSQKVFTNWELSGQMVSAFFGFLTVFPVYFLMKALFNRTVALIASMLFVVHPYLVRFSAEVIRGPSFWFFFVTSLWVGWEAICRKRAWLFFLTSLLAGVSFLLRPEGIFVLPVMAAWVLLEDWKELRSTLRQRVVAVLILLVTVPALVAPAVLYLKQRTGHWYLARTKDIARFALLAPTLRGIEKGLERVKVDMPVDSPEARIERYRLEQFLSLAREHRMGIVGLEFVKKFQKALHPLLLLLLLVGVIKRRTLPYHRREELFLLLVLLVLFLVLWRYGTVMFYVGTRHMMVPVILCLGWVGVGVIEAGWWLRKALAWTRVSLLRSLSSGQIAWVLLAFIVVSLLPKTLAPRRVDKIPMRRAGEWIKDHGPVNPVVMSQAELTRLAFYAGGKFVEIPQNEELYEYAKKRGVHYLAINERDIEETYPGLMGSLNPLRFKREAVFGSPSGPYLITVYSVRE